MKSFVSPGLEGKVALVTGGAKGIGRAAALLFGEAKAQVAVSDVDVAQGEATAAAIRDRGGEAIFLRADVTVEAEVAAMVAATVAHFGALDCAFNNAGLGGVHAPFHELALADWERILAADLTSVFLCMKHELAHMAAVGRGAIVNTASGAGFVPAPGMPHYTAAKHGVLGLTKLAAKEYARAGIRVNAICPGVTDTAMMQDFIGGSAELERMMLDTLPFGRMARAEEVAGAAVWLCSDAASFVSGDSMLVDGASVCR
ncbi:glucose 1-dehydrogenase [Sphingobium estronivorans]|uniref:glucose 1-dehydrogenase n=1 Tax=Sphingobium estronivorans TaxID=1577690 RepID=UPI00123B874E|nr:glucose 1-dehydrogenase [Sphingobium estronivorans]